MFNLRYRLLSTNYTWKLVYQLRTNCPKSLSTSSRTLQTFTQQETVTHCLLFISQPIYLHNVFTANHITHLPTATLSIELSNRSPGFLNFRLTETITWLRTWLPHKLSKRQSQTTVVLSTPTTQMIFFNQIAHLDSIKICYSLVQTIFLELKVLGDMFQSQNVGFYMIANDRRRSQKIELGLSSSIVCDHDRRIEDDRRSVCPYTECINGGLIIILLSKC